jgi:hypothetical protein
MTMLWLMAESSSQKAEGEGSTFALFSPAAETDDGWNR